MADDNQALLLQISADLSKLEKSLNRAKGVVDKDASDIEKRAKRMAQNLEKAGDVNVNIGFLKVLDSSRLRVLDDGASKLGVFGGALEELGPYGLAASASIIALTAALSGARAAAAYGDAIGDIAGKLHVTTDALQEYRYAVRLAGGEEEGADQALEAFSVTLGKAQAGLPKALKAFKELGFTKAQVKDIKDVDSGLRSVAERIAGLSNVQKDAVIDQLGLTGMKPLLEAGVDEMSRLREEAHKVGIVMDAELIKRAGTINDKFETVSKVIDVQLKSALVDLGPILVGLLGLVGQLARGFADIADKMRPLDRKTLDYLERDQAKILEQINKGGANTGVGRVPVAALMKRYWDNAAQIQKYKAAAPPETPTATLGDVGGGGSKAPDRSAENLESARSQSLNAERGVYQALLSLTDDIESRRKLQQQILQLETQQDAAELARKRIEINQSHDSNKAAQLAELNKVEASQKEAAAAKARAIDAEAQIAEQERLHRIHQDLANAQIDELRAQESLTTDRKERARLEHKILEIQKALDDEGRKNDHDAKQLRATAAAGEPVEIVTDPRAQNAADRAAASAHALIDRDAEGPWQRWVEDHIRGAQAVRDEFEDLRVRGVESFNDAIADSIVNGRNMGDALGGVLKQLIADYLKLRLAQREAGLFKAADSFFGGFHLFGSSRKSAYTVKPQEDDGGFTPRAGGGPVRRGVGYWVGENGPEPFFPDQNGTIIPNGGARFPVLDRAAAAAASLQMHSTYHIDGAIGREELAQAIGQAHDSAVARAKSEIRRALPGWQKQIGKRGA